MSGGDSGPDLRAAVNAGLGLLRATGRALSPWLLASAAVAAEPVPVGPGRLVIDVGVPLEVFTYKPAAFREGPLILVFHGVGRNAEDYRDYAIPLAERFQAMVAAPRFDKERFPLEAYQAGGLLAHGAPAERDKWTFSMVPRLIAEIRAREGKPALPVLALGHSAGGQFVQRMAAFFPEHGAVRLVAANPGSHVFPTRAANFRYGFGGLPAELGSDEAIRRYLGARLVLYLGTKDTEPSADNLDSSAEAKRQGPHRYARGLACFEEARRLAEERGWAFGWRKVEAQGIGHDAAAMFKAPEVAEALFGSADPGGK